MNCLEKKLNATQMQILRFMKVVTGFDKIRNKEIRKLFGVGEMARRYREA